MIYFIYILFACLSQIIDLLSIVFLNWIVAAFAGADGNLPSWLSYFQTFDATLDEGMLSRQRELAAGLGGTDWIAFNPTPTNWFETYWNRALWLFRNSAYGFDYYVFGIKWAPQQWRVVKYVESDTLTLFIAVGNGFNLFAYGRYGTAKIGWKAWNMYDGSTKTFGGTWGDAGLIPIAFTLTPFSRKVPAAAA